MSLWPMIGDLAAQTQAGQDINGAYNMYNKAAGNPASQLIGQPGGFSFGSKPTDPNASLGKGDFDPTVTQGNSSTMLDKSAVRDLYLKNQSQIKSGQSSLAPVDSGIIGSLATQGNSPMQYMGQVQSKDGILGNLLKTAAMAAVA